MPGSSSPSDASPRGAPATVSDRTWHEKSRTEQLSGLTLKVRRKAAPASHGRLSASGRSSPVLRPRTEHAMTARHQRHRQRFAPARLEAPTTPPDPRAVGMSAALAGQPVEHPGRQVLPAGRVRATIAAQDIAGRLFDHLLDANNASSPGVPRIKDLTLLSALGPVGVPPPGCTTADPTQPLAENHPSPACPRTTSLEVTPSPLDWLETQPLARVRKPLRPSIVARSQPPRSSCGRSRGRFGVSASVSRA